METIVERRVLTQERERFRAVLDEATDAIRIVDADTHAILDCNRADCELSGLSRPAMLGRDSRPFWPSSVAAGNETAGARVAGVGRTQSVLSRTRRAACCRWTARDAPSSTVTTATRS